MSDSTNELRMCPTRIDAAPVLFAHKVTDGQCQDRQRGHYHKCFTCAFNNVYVQAHGAPDVRTAVREVKRIVRVG
jgi:hypothetical protein